jgi:rubrerythrin
MPAPVSTRRELVRRGFAAGALPLLLAVDTAFAGVVGDRQFLRAAIRLEQMAVRAYDLAAMSRKLEGKARAAAEVFGAQEAEHLRALTSALEDLGARPPAPRGVPGLREALSGEGGAITAFLIELEERTIAAYYRAHATIRSAKLLATVTSVMANEAQHLVVLRQALGKEPSPRAFVTGGS